MSKEMVISANPHETRVAIMEEGQLCEYYVERQKEFALVGSIYKGRVTRVLPGMQSAFVEIGLDSDAFLYVTDFLEETEELDHIVTTVVDKVEKMEEQGGHVFATENPSAPALEPADVERAPSAFQLPRATTRKRSLGEGEHERARRRSAGLCSGSAGGGAPDCAATRSQRARPPQDRPRYEGRTARRQPGFWTPRWRRTAGAADASIAVADAEAAATASAEGRDLPPSKYASPRAPEEQPVERGAAAKGTCRSFCPGESLAKYREKPPVAAPNASSAAAPSLNEETHSIRYRAQRRSLKPMQEHARRLRSRSSHAPRISRTSNLAHRQPREEYRPSSTSLVAGSSRCPARHFRNGSGTEPRSEPMPPAAAFIPEPEAPHPFAQHEEPVEKTLHLYENTLTDHVPHVEPADHEKDGRRGRAGQVHPRSGSLRRSARRRGAERRRSGSARRARRRSADRGRGAGSAAKGICGVRRSPRSAGSSASGESSRGRNPRRRGRGVRRGRAR